MTYHRLEREKLEWRWLGRSDYAASERLQATLAKERQQGDRLDTLLLLEHPPVFTLGRSADVSDILVDDANREQAGVTIERCDRGGKVTYHGPGQLVGYLFCHLPERHLTVPQFVWRVEEGMRLWIAEQGIQVERHPQLPGLWYQGAKMASLGFHISRGVSRHGFAINLQPNLRFFEWIVPCGTPMQITSLSEHTGKSYDLNLIAGSVAEAMGCALSCDPHSSSEELPSEARLSVSTGLVVTSSS